MAFSFLPSATAKATPRSQWVCISSGIHPSFGGVNYRRQIFLCHHEGIYRFDDLTFSDNDQFLEFQRLLTLGLMARKVLAASMPL